MFKGKLVRTRDDEYCIICETLQPKDSNGNVSFITLLVSDKKPILYTITKHCIDTIYTELSEVESVLGRKFSTISSFLRY